MTIILNISKLLIFNLITKLYILFFSLRELIDIRLYFRHLRVIKIFKNKKKNDLKKYLMIFVIYEKKKLSFSTKNLIKAVNSLNIDLFVVSNNNINENDLLFLKKNTYKILIRKNLGQCFGGYKDAISFENIKKYKKLILINDSMFFFNKKLLTKLISKILHTKKKFVSLNVNYINYHAQSFFMVFDTSIIKKSFFLDFWQNYKLTNIRPLIIKNGEQRLTDIFKLNKITPYALINPTYVSEKVNNLSNKKIGLINKLIANKSNNLIKDNISKKIHFKLLNSNPTHEYFDIVAIACKLSLFKKDLFIRKIYSINKFKNLLKYLKIEKKEIDEAVKIIRQRGNYSNYNFFKKILFKFHLTN